MCGHILGYKIASIGCVQVVVLLPLTLAFDHEAILWQPKQQTTPLKSIAFMGGSLTRYQYLSLAYFVTHGTWIDPRTKPNLVVEGDHASWNAFYNATTTAYEGFEKCDCYRSQKWDLKSLTENRYYVAPHWNLYYIQAFGSIPSHGHWNPLVLPSTQPPFKRNASFMWEYDWPNTILNHVALIRPKPQWIVLNAGHWANDFINPEYRTRVIQAIRDAGIKSGGLGVPPNFREAKRKQQHTPDRTHLRQHNWRRIIKCVL